MSTPADPHSIAAQMNRNINGAAHVMKALSNETRIMLMCLLMDGEKSVNALAKALDMRVPAISQHLSKMRMGGLVSARRAGQTIYYKAAKGLGSEIIGTVCAHYK